MIAIWSAPCSAATRAASLGVAPPWAAGLLDSGRHRRRRQNHLLGCASHTPRKSLPILDAVLDRSMHLAKSETVDSDMAAAGLKQRSPCILVGQLATPTRRPRVRAALSRTRCRVPVRAAATARVSLLTIALT
jgi:hypothetical protein